VVDRPPAPERRLDTDPAVGEPSFRDTESHEGPTRPPIPPASSSSGSITLRRRMDLFPVDDSNSDGETRKIRGVSLEELEGAPMRRPGSLAHDPSVEFGEASWPDDLALEGHPSLVDDDEDVPTKAAPLRPAAPASRVARAARLAGDDATTDPDPRAPERAQDTEAPAPHATSSSEPPAGQAAPRSPWSAERAPSAHDGAALVPGSDPPPPTPPSGPSRAARALVFTGMTLLGGALAALVSSRFTKPLAEPSPAPAASSPLVQAAIASALPAPSDAPSAALPSASSSAAPPPPASAAGEEDALIDALSLLREGMGACVHEGLGTLPGSSPAVPRSLAQTRAPGYLTLPPDWKTSVWSCARFRWSTPMRFQIQWQIVKVNAEGLGVAWLDRDGDGIADRAFAFRAVMGAAKGELTLGEITAIDPAHAVVPVY
jgi:hypothetical protein